MEISILRYNLTIFSAPNENKIWAFGGLSSPKWEGLLGEVISGPVGFLRVNKHIFGLYGDDVDDNDDKNDNC